MKKLLVLFFVLCYAGFLQAQNAPDTLSNAQKSANADDPSQFITRIEIYNELQRYNKADIYLNQTVLRTIVKIGKRFSTRVDVPYVYNSFAASESQRKSGIGDVSVRLLGFSFLEKSKSAFTASIEASFNTAQAPTLGTGKNLLIPMLTYTLSLPKQKMLLALTFQQTNSVWGDENRKDISFSKLQFFILKKWTKKFWTVLDPELMIDYVNGGASMILRSRFAYAPTPRINIWTSPSVGLFGDFIGRYQWSMDVGSRFFLGRSTALRKKKGVSGN